MSRALRLLRRGLLLRCPACGRATFVRRPLAVHDRCRVCGLVFEHDDGFFLGALVLNYMVAFLFGVVPAAVLVATGVWGAPVAVLYAAAVALFFPVVFYWHAKSLWMAIYYIAVPDDLRSSGRSAPADVTKPRDAGPLSAEERERQQLEEALAALEGGKPVYRRGGRGGA